MSRMAFMSGARAYDRLVSLDLSSVFLGMVSIIISYTMRNIQPVSKFASRFHNTSEPVIANNSANSFSQVSVFPIK